MTAARASSEMAILPTAETGRCFVCDKPDLTTAHWCGTCGLFVCVAHDAQTAYPLGLHLPSVHLPKPRYGALLPLRKVP